MEGLPDTVRIPKGAVHTRTLAKLPLEVTLLLGGAVVTESIFAWPGIGRLLVESIFARDYTVIQTVVFFSATIIVLINLVVDLCYAWLDPRVRLD